VPNGSSEIEALNSINASRCLSETGEGAMAKEKKGFEGEEAL
jgi:hypothetical protein